MALAWITIFFVFFAWSAIEPEDPIIWAMEVFPAAIGLLILAATWNRFHLTGLAYWLILLHAIILMIGGHYTYAKVPFFDWLKEHFELTRNNYDKVGHFMQGFVPAIIARELILRNTPLKNGGWLFAIVISVISLSYIVLTRVCELIVKFAEFE